MGRGLPREEADVWSMRLKSSRVQVNLPTLDKGRLSGPIVIEPMSNVPDAGWLLDGWQLLLGLFSYPSGSDYMVFIPCVSSSAA